MTNGLKVLIITLIVIIGLLASTSGYFYAKSLNLENQTKDTTANTAPSEGTVSDTSTATTDTATPAGSTASASITQASSSGNRPSAPTDTYTVTSGDTMSIIGGKLDISWLTLAEANGLTTDDANKIKVGQVLIVPKNNQISYTVNTAKAQELQNKANSGTDTFRFSAADTAKSDAPTAYGLAVTDSFTLKSTDTTTGVATVTGVHNGKNYEIKLTQPITKGDKGIWAIVSIKLVN